MYSDQPPARAAGSSGQRQYSRDTYPATDSKQRSAQACAALISFANQTSGTNRIQFSSAHRPRVQIRGHRFRLAWWFWREAPTRSHSELGRETSQRQWYCVLRHGRVDRCQACRDRRALIILIHAAKSAAGCVSRMPAVSFQLPRGGAVR